MDVAVAEGIGNTTLLTLRSIARSVRLKDITPILDALSIEIVSFGTEKDPRGIECRFCLTDATGGKLLMPDIERLLDALGRDLPMHVTRPTLQQTKDSMEHEHADGVVLPLARSESQRRASPKNVTWAIEQTARDDLSKPEILPSVEKASATSSTSPVYVTPSSSAAGSASDTKHTAAELGVKAELSLTVAVSEGLNPEGPPCFPIHQASTAGDEECDEALWTGGICCDDPVERIMSRPVRWIAKEADLGQAKALMNLYGISALMVDTGEEEPGGRI